MSYNGYIFVVFILFPSLFLYYACLLAVSAIDHLLIAVLPVPYLLFLLYNRKNYFSVFSLSSTGIIVKCFGKTWFSATWNEINYVGRFRRNIGKASQNWIFISKTEVVLNYSNISQLAPRNQGLKNQGVFIQITEKSPTFSEFINDGQIKWCGIYERGEQI